VAARDEGMAQTLAIGTGLAQTQIEKTLETKRKGLIACRAQGEFCRVDRGPCLSATNLGGDLRNCK